MKCWFFHDFQEESRQTTEVYGADATLLGYPIKTYTEFLMKCSKCGKRKIQKLNGDWSKIR